MYLREKVFRDFAEKNQLPVITENCPACFAIPKERRRVKNLLAAQEHLNPNLFSCLLRSMQPLMKTNMKTLVRLAQEREEELKKSGGKGVLQRDDEKEKGNDEW